MDFGGENSTEEKCHLRVSYLGKKPLTVDVNFDYFLPIFFFFWYLKNIFFLLVFNSLEMKHVVQLIVKEKTINPTFQRLKTVVAKKRVHVFLFTFFETGFHVAQASLKFTV